MKPKFLITLILLLAGSLAACQMPAGETPTPTATADFPPELPAVTNTPQPTNTPLPSASPFPTLTSTAALAATGTPLPTDTPAAASTEAGQAAPNVTENPGQDVFKVRFPPNSTGVQIAGTIASGESQRYLIRALEGQTLITEIFAPRSDLDLELFNEIGQKIEPEQQNLNLWSWRLPANQEYRLDLLGGSAETAYRLVINIPRVVRFPTGSYGTLETGTAREGETILYRLRAFAGQTMYLDAAASQGKIALGVYSLQTGAELLPPELEETAWNGVIPQDGHVLVQVLGLEPGENRFTIQFEIR